MAATTQKSIPSYTAHQRNDTIWNVLTLIVLVGTMCLIAGFAVIYLAPNSMFNPLPPASVPQAVVIPSATVKAIIPQTETATAVPAATNEPVPTEIPTALPVIPTEVPEDYIVEVPPLITPVPVVTNANFPQSDAPYPFELRGQISALASTLIHVEQGCSWLGVAGEVFDLQGAPLVGTTIVIGGELEGKNVSLRSLTGTARQYGEAGYEFVLGDHPVASNETLWIQLFDQGEIPLSEKVHFTTNDDCQRNLVLINFRQVK